MTKLTTIGFLLVPAELLGSLLLLCLVLAALCRIVGAKAASNGLIATGIAIPVVTVIVEAVLNEFFASLPPHLVQPVGWLVLLLVYLFVFGALMSLVFGRRAWDEAKGHLLADAIRGVFRLAFSWPVILALVALGAYLGLLRG